MSDNNTWGPTELNVLENAIWGILPKSICINGNEPNAGSKMDGRIETIFDSILSYIHYFVGDIFNENVDDELGEKIEQSRINISVYDLQTDDGVRDIITPIPTVKTMVDLIPEELLNSRATFLDPACKDGAFLVEIYDRLMESNDLKERFRNDGQRALHILNNQLFGFAVSRGSYEVACMRLYGQCNKEDNETINIKHVDNYINRLRDCYGKGKTSKKLIKYMVFKNEFGRKFNLETEEEVLNMQFDVVIGNPPYSDEASHGSSGSGNAIYPYFMYMGMVIGKHSCLVTPSGWMNKKQIGVSNELLEEIRTAKGFVEIHDFENPKHIFKNVNIQTGVSYYLYNSNTVCENVKYIITDVDGEEKEKITERLCNNSENIIIRDIYADNIIDKIKNKGEFRSFGDTRVGNTNTFGSSSIFESNWDGYRETESKDYTIKYYLNISNKNHRNRCESCRSTEINNLGYAWINEEQIVKNKHLYNRHKVIVNEIITFGDKNITSKAEYIGTNSVCSRSYIPIFADSKDECINICKYIKTRFFRYLVSLLKSGHHMASSTYRFVPDLDFSNTSSDIDWSQSIENIEDQLYQRYGIEEYKEYINKKIAKMD